MKYLNLLLLFFGCLLSANLLAQTPMQIEDDLLKSFNRIDHWYQKTNNTTYVASASDSLFQANDAFARKLEHYGGKFSSTLTYPFNLLKKDLDIPTSSNGLFRIYSWDTETGGTQHFFENVFQYKSGTKTTAEIDTLKSEGYANYQKIYTLKVNGKSYYLAIYLFIESSKYAGNGIHVYTIKNGELISPNLIKTHSGLHNDLSYEYDFGSVVDVDYEKRPRPYFDEKTKIIYLPLVDGNGQMTKRFILYKFTGQYFERVKN
jgi:hypothetical protein